MKKVQKYLLYINHLSLGYLLVIVLLVYILTVLVFAIAYDLGGFVKSAGKEEVGITQCLYFSFITQSTVGYGDFHPVGWGRLVVAVQTTLALLIFAVGAGAIVFRMITPHEEGIVFDRWVVYYPQSRKFRIRYVNRLPVDIWMAKVELRFRHWRQTRQGDRKISRKKVAMQRPLITQIKPMTPLFSSTAPIEEIMGGEGLQVGKDVFLEPVHINRDSSIDVTMHASYFGGSVVFTKRWHHDDIRCGRFDETYEDPTRIDWSKWDSMTEVNPGVCAECEFGGQCPLRRQ